MIKRTAIITIVIVLFLVILSCYACAQLVNPSVRQTSWESRDNFIEYERDLRNVLAKHGLEVVSTESQDGVLLRSLTLHVEASDDSRLSVRLENNDGREWFFIRQYNRLSNSDYLYEMVDVALLEDLTNVISGIIVTEEDIRGVLQWAEERCLESKQGRPGWEGIVATGESALNFTGEWTLFYEARGQTVISEVFESRGLTYRGTRESILLWQDHIRSVLKFVLL